MGADGAPGRWLRVAAERSGADRPGHGGPFTEYYGQAVGWLPPAAVGG